MSWTVAPESLGLRIAMEAARAASVRVRLGYASSYFGSRTEDLEFLVHDYPGSYRVTLEVGTCGLPVLSICSALSHPALPVLSLVVQDFAGVGAYDLTDDACALATDETR